MRTDELERIRRKVERGDPVSARELGLLEAEVEGGSAEAKLVLGHALINASKEEDALPLAESLTRDLPKLPGAHLLLARALTGLERYPDAERALLAALKLAPDDPEPKKALALLGLRKGDVKKAKAAMAEVLEKDPFDEEARMVAEDLEEDDLPAPPEGDKGTLDEFMAALREALTARQVAFLQQRDELLVKLPEKKLARLSLESLYGSYVRDGHDLESAAEAIARELSGAQAPIPQSREELLPLLRPVLRDASFAEKATGAVRREGPADLFVYYVVHHPELLRYLPLSALDDGLTLAEIDERAWQNLAEVAEPPKALTVKDGVLDIGEGERGLFGFCVQDGYDAARILSPPHQALLAGAAGAGPYRVWLGQRELSLFCRAEDEKAVGLLSALAVGPGGISGQFLLAGGVLRRAG